MIEYWHLTNFSTENGREKDFRYFIAYKNDKNNQVKVYLASRNEWTSNNLTMVFHKMVDFDRFV